MICVQVQYHLCNSYHINASQVTLLTAARFEVWNGFLLGQFFQAFLATCFLLCEK